MQCYHLPSATPFRGRGAFATECRKNESRRNIFPKLGAFLPHDLPNHVLPWSLRGSHDALIPLPTQGHATPFGHQPHQFEIAGIQRAFGHKLDGYIACRKRLCSLPEHIQDDAV